MTTLREAAQQALTYEEFCNTPLTHTMGLTGDWGSHRMYRNEAIGIQKEVVAKRKRHGDIYSGWKDGEAYFYMDRDPREFANVACLYEAWMARVCGVLTVTDIGGKQ